MLYKRISIKKILKSCTYFVIFIIIVIIFLECISTVYDVDKTCQKNFVFTKKVDRAMIIVPHQDDEVFTAGGIIERLTKNNIETFVVFFTDGNSNDDIGRIRQKEAIESCKQLGCDPKNIICLQFPNRQQTDTTDASGVSSISLRDSMKLKIKDLIKEKKPEYILCTDFDFHRDHRTLSLIFDEVVGEMLQDKEIGSPIIHKGFAYQTSYNATEDFYAINIKSTKKPIEPQNKLYDTDEPAYTWKDRIRIPLLSGSITHTAFNNTQYNAFSEHKTQCLTMKAYSALNGDNVLWERRTDNLLYDATISVSSGESNRLNDFKIIDTKDVTIKYKQNVLFEDYLWVPTENDLNPFIDISFNKPTKASYIRFFEDVDLAENIHDINILVNDTLSIHTGILNNDGSPTSVYLGDNITIKSLRLSNFKVSGTKPALAEIELLPSKLQGNRVLINKIIEKSTGDFIYKYYVEDKVSKVELSRYSTDEISQNMVILENKGSVTIKDGSLLLGKDFESCEVILTDSDKNVYDKVEIVRLSSFDKVMILTIQKYDQTKLAIADTFYRNRLVHSIIKQTIFKAIKRELGL